MKTVIAQKQSSDQVDTYHAGINQNKAKGAILFSNKADFGSIRIIIDKEMYDIMIKESILQ